MIVIDTTAESKLAHALEALRAEPDANRYLHGKFSRTPLHVARAKQHRVQIVQLVQHTIGSETPHVYFCEDGDMFILASFIPTREAHALMLAISDLFHEPVTDEWIEYGEVNRHINRLLLVVEAKLELQRQARELLQREIARQKMERKRQTILATGTHVSLRDMAARRESRVAPELMLIEDDAFSRKLVENVLGKQFSMTSLATADNALATYARLAPNLVFLDIDLPDVTGHELLARIVALDPEAHVVMLSGNADQENIAKALRIGAKGFVAKPFTRDKLFQYIHRCPGISPTVHS